MKLNYDFDNKDFMFEIDDETALKDLKTFYGEANEKDIYESKSIEFLKALYHDKAYSEYCDIYLLKNNPYRYSKNG